MSLGDLPTIPRKYKPRIRKLFEKIQTGEISTEQFLTNVVAAMGTATLNAQGLKITGDYGSFEVDQRILADTRDALAAACDLIPLVVRKKFLIKRGNAFTKVFIGPGLWQTKAKPEDVKNKKMPIIEIKKDPKDQLKEKITNYFHVYLQTPLDEWEPATPGMKIHRMEELAAWMGDDWTNTGAIFRVLQPLTDLTTKEVLDKLNASIDPFCDHVLAKCGV